MNFYSDANLRRDGYVSQLIEKDPWVDLSGIYSLCLPICNINYFKWQVILDSLYSNRYLIFLPLPIYLYHLEISKLWGIFELLKHRISNFPSVIGIWFSHHSRISQIQQDTRSSWKIGRGQNVRGASCESLTGTVKLPYLEHWIQIGTP